MIRVIGIKEKLFREYFYSNLTENELKDILDLNYKEYKELLVKTKEYFNLPSNYRRTPNKYFKYDKDSYYIVKYSDDMEFNIIGFYPRLEFAEKKLLELKGSDDKFEIDKATDDNLKELISYGYVKLGWNWEKLMSRCKLPYADFYRLFNDVKKSTGLNVNRKDRYIYKCNEGFKISRTFNGKQVMYGCYTDKEYAICVRDYLESINWDKSVFNRNWRLIEKSSVK